MIFSIIVSTLARGLSIKLWILVVDLVSSMEMIEKVPWQGAGTKVRGGRKNPFVFFEKSYVLNSSEESISAYEEGLFENQS